MEKREIIEYWRSEAEESLRVAGHLFAKKDENIPRTHNLSRIAIAAGLKLEEEMLTNFIRITAFNLESRYPDYKKRFRSKCTREFTSKELNKIEEIFQWLESIK